MLIKLRFSSFKKFRNNPDEQQGDAAEGRANMKIETPSGNHAILAMNGQEAYVMRGGTVESKSMEASFKTADGFRIINTLAFANAISIMKSFNLLRNPMYLRARFIYGTIICGWTCVQFWGI